MSGRRPVHQQFFARGRTPFGGRLTLDYEFWWRASVQRMRATALPLLTGALVLLGACKDPPGVEVDPRLLIPSDAAVVAGFEINPIKNSALAGPLQGVMSDDPDTKGIISAVSKCEIDSSKLRVTLAATSDETAFLAALEAPAIGSKSVVRCLEKEFGEASGESSGLILFETKGKVAATPQEGGGYVIILNSHALIVVERAWETEVFAAIENASERKQDTPIAKAVNAIDPTTDAWIIYHPSDSERADLGDIPGLDKVTMLTATADFSDGLQLDVGFEFPDGEGAGVFAQTASMLIDEFKPALAEASLPATLLDSAAPKLDGANVTSQLSVSNAEIPSVLAAVGPWLME